MPTDSPPPPLAEVDAIVALTDRVVRNLRITECYHRLARAVQARAGGGANWCAFATWASRQAGCTIRGEDLLERLAAPSERASARHPLRSLWRALLRRGLLRPETRLGRLAREIHSPMDALERASEAVARGNLKVFAEIGREFARWLAADLAETPPDASASRRFLEDLRPGEPPQGQARLRAAFAHLQGAQQAADPAAGERLRLLANLEIGLHEQTRLQPDIVAALEAGAVTAGDLGLRLLRALWPTVSRRAEAALRPLAWLLAWPARRFLAFARRETRRAVTESLMQLTLPRGVVLALGHDLPALPAAGAPADDPPELRDLRAAYESSPAGPDRAPDDWGDLAQRMHTILHLFAAYHARPELFDPPFTDAQVRLILAGELPPDVA